MDNSETTVVITGASGFIGMYCVREILSAGYRVRGTLRSLGKEASVRKALAVDDEQAERLTFAAANLMEDAGWDEVMAGATYVLHVASPVPSEEPKDEMEVIRPARDGTLRVLKAASRAHVSRVVVTSSVAAIASGHDYTPGRVYTEDDWSNLDGKIATYDKSKTLAERAAWDFVSTLQGDEAFELATINPVFVLGPSLLGIDNASNEVIGKLLRREIPGCPKLLLPLVDVRDTARAHLLAMTVPEAAGKRFILCTDQRWMVDIAKFLKQSGHNVATRELPTWLMRIVALFDKTMALAIPMLDREETFSGEQTAAVLGWEGRKMQEMVTDAANSMSARY